MAIWVEPQALFLLVLMAHLISTPVTEKQMWEQFIVLGKQNGTKMDTSSAPEVVNRAKTLVFPGNPSKRKFLLQLGSVPVLSRYWWYLNSGSCLVFVQCSLQVCIPEPGSLLAVYKGKRENIKDLTLSRFPDQNQWERRREETLLKY